jgi:hypothetical protein
MNQLPIHTILTLLVTAQVLTSMLEILDKLLSSFGQDAFDSLNWRTRTFTGGRGNYGEYYQTLFAFVVVAMYVLCHSATYFIHVATLTVAINSNEQALITVLILNNFAEIKGFVFKKFDKTNLFQLACSDITERFQLVLFLVAILVVACVQAGPEWSQTLPDHLFVILLMYVVCYTIVLLFFLVCVFLSLSYPSIASCLPSMTRHDV